MTPDAPAPDLSALADVLLDHDERTAREDAAAAADPQPA